MSIGKHEVERKEEEEEKERKMRERKGRKRKKEIGERKSIQSELQGDDVTSTVEFLSGLLHCFNPFTGADWHKSKAIE